MQVSEQQAVAVTSRWIREVVVGAESIFYAVTRARDEEGIYRDMLAALDRFQQSDEREMATGFFIIPNGMARFEEFNAFMTLADQAVVNAGLAGVIQMVAFHPGILFAETDEEDPANYTNRSPYPMLHLIREDDLEAAVAGYPDPDAIPERNIRLLRRMGLTRVRELLARCYTASAT